MSIPTHGDRPLQWRRIWLGLAVLLACTTVASAQEQASRLILPAGDLPYALFDDYRVDFTHNGAFVVSRDGRNLFDVGLVYSRPEWSEWGTQIRKASPEDSWQAADANGTGLRTKGTLYDYKGNPRFSFVQQTKVLPDGLRVSYEVAPLARRVISTCGVTLHLPLPQTADAEVAFWPGFGMVDLPDELSAWDIHSESARAAAVYVGGAPRVGVVGDGEFDWQINDYRQWNVNAYWLIGSDAELARALSRGRKGSVSFEIRFGTAVCRRANAGAAVCETDARGRTAVYVGGAKVAEGGLAWDRPAVQWLHEQACAAESPAGRRVVAAADGAKVDYSVELTAGEDARSPVNCSARAGSAAHPADGLEFVLAVPVSEATSEPEPTSAGALHTVTVALRRGGPLTLQARAPWTVRSAFAAGAQCYLLCIPTTPGEDGGAAAWVGIEPVPPPAEDAGGPMP